MSVVDLHGRNDRVSCISCGCSLSRRIVQKQIAQLNEAFVRATTMSGTPKSMRADGDAEVDTSDLSEVSDCAVLTNIVTSHSLLFPTARGVEAS